MTQSSNGVQKIKHVRLILYEHAQRLPNETPAKYVLNYIEQNSDVTKLRGGQITTWLKLLEKDLDEIRKHTDEDIKQILWNRSAWRQQIQKTIPNGTLNAKIKSVISVPIKDCFHDYPIAHFHNMPWSTWRHIIMQLNSASWILMMTRDGGRGGRDGSKYCKPHTNKDTVKMSMIALIYHYV